MKIMKRNTVEIHVWLLRNGYRQVDIQRDLAMKINLQVMHTIQGKRNDRRVLRWLLDKGCPVEYLALPDDLKEAA